MELKFNRMKSLFLVICALTVWLTVLLQFILIIMNRIASFPETVVRFFSFYTILTNILVACCFTALFLKTRSGKDGFFTKPGVLTATMVYIIVVGGVYNIILRYLWAPQGLQRIVDELLHTIIPILFVLYWVIATPKVNLQWKSIFLWLVYPFLYLMFILLRGSISGFYPYPFINVNELGYSIALLNSGYILAAFILLSLLVITYVKTMKKWCL